MHLCVPRNMVQSAGMYATLLQSDDPAIVIETLNQYRVREKMPENIGEYTVPLGVPEVMVKGDDITIVSYGATLWKVMEAVESLKEWNIHPEVIDVQTLMPFDIPGMRSEERRVGRD